MKAEPAGAPGPVVEPVRRRFQHKCLRERGYAFAKKMPESEQVRLSFPPKTSAVEFCPTRWTPFSLNSRRGGYVVVLAGARICLKSPANAGRRCARFCAGTASFLWEKCPPGGWRV